MARRRGGYIDPMAFVNQQQQGGGGLKDLASLMGLLGLGPGEEGEAATREREAKAQQAQQAWYEGQIGQQKAGTEAQTATETQKLGLQEKQLAAQERAALAAELTQREAKKFQEEATLRDIAAKDFPKLQEALNRAKDPVEQEILLKAANVKEGLEEIGKRRQGKFAGGLEEAYKGFAKNPKAIAAFLESQKAVPGFEEMVKSADWQRLNQGMPAPQPGLLSRIFGGGGGAATPPVAAPLPEARRPEDYVPEWQQVGPVAGEYQPGASFPRQVQEAVPPPVDKVMQIAGVTGRNAAVPFVYEPGGPSAMPGVVQQPGFLENFLRQISDYGASRPERVPAERYPYPIGHGMPPPVGGPIDPRLLQP